MDKWLQYELFPVIVIGIRPQLLGRGVVSNFYGLQQRKG